VTGATVTARGRYDSLLTALGIVGVRLIAGIAAARLALTFGRAASQMDWGNSSLAHLFVRWDAGWYVGIAKSGYTPAASHAFFPAYPLLIRIGSPLLGYSGAALAVSWIGAVVATWGVLDVAGRFASRQSAWAGAMFLAWNPVSIFFIAAYPEGVLIAAMVWSLRFSLDKRWWPAAGLAGFASCVMPVGVVSALVVGLAVALDERGPRGLLRGTFFAALGEVGLAGYLVYCGVTTGNPLIFQTVSQQTWRLHLTYPFHSVLSALAREFTTSVDPAHSVVLLVNGLSGALVGVIAAAGLYLCRRDRRLVLPSTLLALATLVSVLTIDASLEGTARYVLFLAPLYVLVPILLDKVPHELRTLVTSNLLLVSALLSVLYAAMFNLGWWLT
jgi:hypothetical protein